MLLHSMHDYSMLDIFASIPIWLKLHSISSILFAILLPCIWHLSFVHAGFSLCNALCHSSFDHYSYSALPLFLLRHAIIASSMLTAIIHLMALHSYKQTLRRSLYTGLTPPPPHREGSNVGRGCVFFLHWNSRTKCQRYDGITWTNHQCKLTCIWRDIWIYFPVGSRWRLNVGSKPEVAYSCVKHLSTFSGVLCKASPWMCV